MSALAAAAAAAASSAARRLSSSLDDDQQKIVNNRVIHQGEKGNVKNGQKPDLVQSEEVHKIKL